MAIPPEPGDALAHALGKFILAHLPYGPPVPDPQLPPLPTAERPLPPSATDATLAKKIPDGYGTHNVVDIYGAYDDYNVQKPFTMQTFVDNDELPAILEQYAPERAAKLMSWTIDDAKHQVTKAIRIWYTYERVGATGRPAGANGPDDPGDPKIVGAWLVIGYVGNGH